MAEGGWLPHNIRMTNRAVVRELIRHMIRRNHRSEIYLVTTKAIGLISRIASVRVARSAIHPGVRAAQWEGGLRMIKFRRSPNRIRMADGAIM
jgi:hypothetical protein